MSWADMEAATTGSAEKRCAVVTGGNKGIGLEICGQLASNGIAVILTARDEKKGMEAINSLKALGLSDVFFHQLDVTDPQSISSLAKYVQTHFRKLDILVNNAGIIGLVTDQEAFKAFGREGDFEWNSVYLQLSEDKIEVIEKFMKQTYEMAEECLKTNYYGTKGATEALLPLLQLSNSARIVNVSSLYGELSNIANEMVKAELQNVESLTEEKIDGIVQQFLRDFKNNNLKANGWPLMMSAYTVSKVAMNAYTRIMAKKCPAFRVNCVHPGYVKTDLTSHTGFLTLKEGARAPVMLALLPDDGPSGFYFREMEPSTF